MNNNYTNSFNLRTSDFTKNNCISPVAVLDLFQEVAGAHAEILGCGFNEMLDKEFLWVVVRARYRVLKQPGYHTFVEVSTWPSKPTRIGFERQYEIKDSFGDIAIIGSTDWVVMHSKQRKLVSVSDIYPSNMEYIEHKCFEDRSKRLRDFETADSGFEVVVQYSDIDLNGHVNNTRYAAFVLNAINPAQNEQIYELQIDYHKELRLFDRVTVYVKRENGEIFAKGINQNSELCFVCKIVLK